MKDIGATEAGLFKLYICSMATHFAIKFSDPILSFIPYKKDIRTLSLLKKDVYFQRFKQVNVFVDRSYYGPYYLSLNVLKLPKDQEKKVQVGKDQEKAQSEKDSHSKNRGGKKTKVTIRYLYHKNIS